MWLFKLIFWLGYCNSMMNPIIYAANSREFKRAFARILRCQLRRRPRSFVETQLSRSVATEMSKLTRFATLHRKDASNGTSRQKCGETQDRKSHGGLGTLSLLLHSVQSGKSSCNRKRSTGTCDPMDRLQSPIASLRLLHNQKGIDSSTTLESGLQFATPTSPISSDDEVTYCQQFDEEDDVLMSEEERSDEDQQMSPLMPRRTSSQRSRGSRSSGHGNTRHSGGYSMIPHIVIDNVDDSYRDTPKDNTNCETDPATSSAEPVSRQPAVLPPSVHHDQVRNTVPRISFTNNNEDNIMWL